MDDPAAGRARLAAIERELARLRHRHDIAMSAFKFEEAIALGPAIAALEKEQRALTETLAADPAEPLPTGIVPVLAKPTRRPRRRAGDDKPGAAATAHRDGHNVPRLIQLRAR